MTWVYLLYLSINKVYKYFIYIPLFLTKLKCFSVSFFLKVHLFLWTCCCTESSLTEEEISDGELADLLAEVEEIPSTSSRLRPSSTNRPSSSTERRHSARIQNRGDSRPSYGPQTSWVGSVLRRLLLFKELLLLLMNWEKHNFSLRSNVSHNFSFFAAALSLQPVLPSNYQQPPATIHQLIRECIFSLATGETGCQGSPTGS